jgi:hypothetical protein
MAATSQERYAVVSCHVERPLDDRVWKAFSALQRRRPGGFVVAALMRPPDEEAGESWETWVPRWHEARERGPVGHHTHWTSPSHARPTGSTPAGDRVLAEAEEMSARGVTGTLFCGGGWYADASVATACARLGYLDVTPRTARPDYLDEEAPWAQLEAPARLELPDGPALVSVPTTHSIGELVRAVIRPGGLRDPVVHAYFHDTDLLDPRRRLLLAGGLSLLGRRRVATDLDRLAELVSFAERRWQTAARP